MCYSHSVSDVMTVALSLLHCVASHRGALLQTTLSILSFISFISLPSSCMSMRILPCLLYFMTPHVRSAALAFVVIYPLFSRILTERMLLITTSPQTFSYSFSASASSSSCSSSTHFVRHHGLNHRRKSIHPHIHTSTHQPQD